MKQYPTSQEVDFVVIGSGAAGGIMAAGETNSLPENVDAASAKPERCSRKSERLGFPIELAAGLLNRFEIFRRPHPYPAKGGTEA